MLMLIAAALCVATLCPGAEKAPRPAPAATKAAGSDGGKLAAPVSVTVKNVEMLVLHIPFYCDRVRRHMHRANSAGERAYVYRVELSNGVVGWGESPMNESGRIPRSVGKNPFAIMRNDQIGPGIQMALFDAVGKTLGVPVHALLGRKIRDRVPIAWWAIDMPAADWVAEINESIRRGYTSAKLKARPWRDIRAQIAAVSKAAPKGYRYAIDFNGFLLSADGAMPVLKDLDRDPHVAVYESPFYLDTDLPGGRRLTDAVRGMTAEHFREKCLHARNCDAFLICANYRGATRTIELNALCKSFDKPYWLQMVGTGITTAYMAHFAAVLSHAKLPAVTCHELWEDDLLTKRIEVVKGMIRVPDGPGLGVEVDEAAIRRYRVPAGRPTPKELYLKKPRICRVTIPDGSGGETIHEFPGEKVYYYEFLKGKHPGFIPGVRLEVIEKE